MLDFAKALPQVLASLNLGERLREGRLMTLWPEVVGPTVAAQTRPLKCRDGILHVAVSSSAWLQQLALMRNEIVRHYDRKVGKGAIHEVRFTAHGWSQWPGGDPNYQELTRKEHGKLELVPVLAPRQQERLNEALEAIGDIELRERAARVLAKAVARQEALRQKGWRACRICGELHDREQRQVCILCEVTKDR